MLQLNCAALCWLHSLLLLLKFLACHLCSVQTLATLAADPIASLVSTAFVGRLGPPEQAAVGVALSVYNTVSSSCT